MRIWGRVSSFKSAELKPGQQGRYRKRIETSTQFIFNCVLVAYKLLPRVRLPGQMVWTQSQSPVLAPQSPTLSMLSQYDWPLGLSV